MQPDHQIGPNVTRERVEHGVRSEAELSGDRLRVSAGGQTANDQNDGMGAEQRLRTAAAAGVTAHRGAVLGINEAPIAGTTRSAARPL